MWPLLLDSVIHLFDVKQLKEAQGKSKEPKYALLYAAALSLDNQLKTVVDYLSENQQKLKS